MLRLLPFRQPEGFDEGNDDIKVFCFKVKALYYIWAILLLDGLIVTINAFGSGDSSGLHLSFYGFGYLLFYIFLGECIVHIHKTSWILYIYGVVRSLVGVIFIILGIGYAIVFPKFLIIIVLAVSLSGYGVLMIYSSCLWIEATTKLSHSQKSIALSGVPLITV
eukprot:TRINITY_DN10235_c0_g1_i1.p1 TRINITY_DN10235_c0_g1~~TRINITY_DN10235_c0_g1_i1.p1  ORF type:complete len:164 (+),score=19.68 TRINITY_DN10235_c0_g1_i1:118-609(+)